MVRGDRPELRSQAAHTRQVLAAGTGNDERDGGILAARSQGRGGIWKLAKVLHYVDVSNDASSFRTVPFEVPGVRPSLRGPCGHSKPLRGQQWPWQPPGGPGAG